MNSTGRRLAGFVQSNAIYRRCDGFLRLLFASVPYATRKVSQSLELSIGAFSPRNAQIATPWAKQPNGLAKRAKRATWGDHRSRFRTSLRIAFCKLQFMIYLSPTHSQRSLNMNTPTSLARDALRLHVLFLRARHRMSQSTLAARAGVSRAVVSRIEQGDTNVTLAVLDRIAAALATESWRLVAPIDTGSSDADVERRLADGPEVFVDAADLLAAIDESASADKAARYSKRGRPKRTAVPA